MNENLKKNNLRYFFAIKRVFLFLYETNISISAYNKTTPYDDPLYCDVAKERLVVYVTKNQKKQYSLPRDAKESIPK